MYRHPSRPPCWGRLGGACWRRGVEKKRGFRRGDKAISAADIIVGGRPRQLRLPALLTSSRWQVPKLFKQQLFLFQCSSQGLGIIRRLCLHTMAPTKMALRADEELGKKDDDHRFSDQTRFRPIQKSRIPRPKRLIVVLIALLLLYEFFKHMPTGLTPASERFNPRFAELKHHTSPHVSVQSPTAPTAPNVHIPPAKVEIEHERNQEQASYDGKIHFYELAQSLPRGKRPTKLPSEAVLFAAASLHSVSDMLPLACRMAAERQNRVHFALMGQEDVSVEGIKQVNGVDDSECPILWHGRLLLPCYAFWIS